MANPDWIQGTSEVKGAATGSSLTLNGVTAGSTLCAAISFSSGTDDYTSVSDGVNAGNYTKEIVQGTGNPDAGVVRLYLAYHKNAGAGNTTITCAFSSSNFLQWGVFELGPCDTTAPLDVDNKKGQSTAGVNPTAPSITTLNAIDVLVNLLLSDGSNYQNNNPPAGFTQRLNVGPGVLVVCTRAVAATGTYGGAAWSCGGATDDYGMAIAAFKNPQAGGFTAKDRRTLSSIGSRVGVRQVHGG